MNKTNFFVGLAVILAIIGFAALFVYSQGLKNEEKVSSSIDSQKTSEDNNSPAALQTTDLVVGMGSEAKDGDTVSVNYIGTLEDGTKFDSSYDRNQPFSFTIGAGNVIQGWDQGIPGMKEGGKRKLVIPYQLAYGEEGRPPQIPPKATLIFEVQLLKIN
ncbi:MAG: hypothetical protein A3A80_01675 [Candidatus Terrybacteria bacterium RIFCSPLOWO2_01_FULL_44_24]|uniref:Peptidyl-prolyl cis-trans isomerase n=1 Tax=Candidatus Terrybacteria bacterium RIFCSPHIGHO2_01_FULL_43_35 TaxID=1802361 RepID=A0A1G2PFL0_9BACT|nr:MAG: hypothetical protein A2828_04055 [Candidatus Terrybacteria bacterium RIFCSPHIGHO2_01_FULL_43_35]OHA49895.1 MAG: hypothetical protein A3B75_03250 [Candidatus Terrybacteria bacterium RIFCSPHIGHO2_02_FULL_43_14]OHA51784.1 MAG: hypothetical protein A3A80_01675 [Candidatus Terrybacteria bacterium RIFCSPLOWO2_01_FULL_44_24]